MSGVSGKRGAREARRKRLEQEKQQREKRRCVPQKQFVQPRIQSSPRGQKQAQSQARSYESGPRLDPAQNRSRGAECSPYSAESRERSSGYQGEMRSEEEKSYLRSHAFQCKYHILDPKRSEEKRVMYSGRSFSMPVATVVSWHLAGIEKEVDQIKQASKPTAPEVGRSVKKEDWPSLAETATQRTQGRKDQARERDLPLEVKVQLRYVAYRDVGDGQSVCPQMSDDKSWKLKDNTDLLKDMNPGDRFTVHFVARNIELIDECTSCENVCFLLENMLKKMHEISNRVIVKAINKLDKLKRPDLAILVYRSVPPEKQIDVQRYTMIRIYAKSGMMAEAETEFNKSDPNVNAYLNIMEGFRVANMPERVFKKYEEMLMCKVEPTDEIEAVAITTLGLMGKIDEAQERFDEWYPKTLKLCRGMIRADIQCGDLDHAKWVFVEVVENPDETIYSEIYAALISAKMYREADRFFKETPDKMKGKVMYASRQERFCQEGHVTVGLDTFDRLEESDRSTVAYHATLKMLLIAERWEDFDRVYKEMPLVKKDQVILQLVMDRRKQQQDIAGTLKIFESIHERNRTSSTHNKVLKGYERARRPLDAMNHFKTKMPESKIGTNTRIIMMHVCRQLGDLEELEDIAWKVPPEDRDEVWVSTFLNTLLDHKKYEKIVELYSDINDKHRSIGVKFAVVDALVELGRKDEALSVFQLREGALTDEMVDFHIQGLFSKDELAKIPKWQHEQGVSTVLALLVERYNKNATILIIGKGHKLYDAFEEKYGENCRVSSANSGILEINPAAKRRRS